MIKVIIVDTHKIVGEGIECLLNSSEEISVGARLSRMAEVAPILAKEKYHVVIINIYTPDDDAINALNTLHKQFPNINLLILSMHSNEHFILKTLKLGAKGYLTKDTSRNEMIEAILTLRNGYDYYGKSITNVILKGYFNKTAEEEKNGQNPLSEREVEILKLFGEGLTNREIADQLFISVRTVESHKNNIMKKINLRTTVDLVKFAIRNNYIEI